MPALLIDRRLQSCSQSELRVLAGKLLEAWSHHGRPEWADMPPRYSRQFEALRIELARRGVQLRLFED